MSEHLHFSDIQSYHEYWGLPAPEHPLFSVLSLSSDDGDIMRCPDQAFLISTDFYSINLKHILSGEIHYGRTQFDFNNGCLLCFGPQQTVKVKGVQTRSNAKTILIHQDFLRGTRVQELIEKAQYFNYAVHEALHLSPKEEALIQGLFDSLEVEYQQNHDAFSKDIILSQIQTLLTYTERFYRRQFQMRMESQNTQLLARFLHALKQVPADRIPSVEGLASELNMTPRYLSDALKVETGKTALENIHIQQIDKAKNLLLGSDDTVATIAYQLGFEYPQYFSRLFKNKVGLTPTQYRNNTPH